MTFLTTLTHVICEILVNSKHYFSSEENENLTKMMTVFTFSLFLYLTNFISYIFITHDCLQEKIDRKLGNYWNTNSVQQFSSIQLFILSM